MIASEKSNENLLAAFRELKSQHEDLQRQIRENAIVSILAELAETSQSIEDLLTVSLKEICSFYKMEFAACFEIKKTSCKNLGFYHKKIDEIRHPPRLTINSAIRRKLRLGSLTLYPEEPLLKKLNLTLQETDIYSSGIFLLPFTIGRNRKGVFIFPLNPGLEDFRTSGYFLLRAVQIISARINNLSVLEDIRKELRQTKRKITQERQSLKKANEILREKIREGERTEHLLREQLRRTKLILDTIQDGYVLIDSEGIITDINPAFCKMTGYTGDQLRGKPFYNLFDGSHLQYKELLADITENRRHRFEIRLRRKDDSLLSVDVSCGIMQRKKDPLIVAFCRDISIYKQMVLDLEKRVREQKSLNMLFHKAGGKLESSEIIKVSLRHLYEVMQPIFCCFYIFDNGTYRFSYSYSEEPAYKPESHFCKNILKQTGYLNQPIKGIEYSYAEDAGGNRISMIFLPLFIQEKPLGILILGDAEERDFSRERDFLEVFGGETASLLQTALLFEEIRKQNEIIETRVRERTKELQEANRKLIDADRLKSIFLASMSHELRTPMNSIIGFTGILLMGLAGELNPEQHKQLSIVKSSAEHLLQLINDLLDISKIEAGKVELRMEEFSVKESIEDLLDSFRVQAQVKGLDIRYSLPENVQIVTDKRRFKQILMNLLSNAIKYTERGYISIQATVLNRNHLGITISDSGIGIRKEHLKVLFEPFTRFHASRIKEQEGTGLGLYLTKKLVSLLNGAISVSSHQGKGTKFTLKFPLSNVQ